MEGGGTSIGVRGEGGLWVDRNVTAEAHPVECCFSHSFLQLHSNLCGHQVDKVLIVGAGQRALKHHTHAHTHLYTRLRQLS